MSEPLFTFGEALDHYAHQHPDEIVLACAREDGSIDDCSRAELEHWSNRLAHRLIEAGVKPGIMVPIVLPTSVAFLAATTAIYKAGGTPMPVSHKLPEAEMSALLALAPVTCILSDSGRVPDSLDPDDYRSGDDHPTPPEVRVSNPVKALSSGGSTGKPKLIVSTGDMRYPLGGHPVALALGFRPGDLKYSPGPLYHNGPFFFSLSMLFHGGRVLLNERFRADRCLRLIEERRPTVLNLVPTMMQRMLHEPTWETADLSSINYVWHLAAPCPPWAKEAFIKRLGGEKIMELWAATESTGTTILNGNEWLAHRGSVGKPAATEIRILDENRNPLPPGEVGEIFTRFAGTAAKYEYLGAKPLEQTEDGFASVGDLGWVDEDGYLYLADRRTDLIISGGANIFPAEVEAVISQHPGVIDVAVIGLSDPDLGRRVHAIVEPADTDNPPDPDDLLALCTDQLVRYKVPRSIEIMARLPRNEAGKIRRLTLREERGG